MTCPFPGMDPYLENSDFRQGFHNGFMHYCQDALQPHLPEPYVATLELRIYFEGSDGSGGPYRVPDLEVVKRGPGGRTAVVSKSAETRTGTTLDLNPAEVREAYLNIREMPGGRIVTSIELLSPSNKRRGVGRSEYQAKQSRLFGQGVNLVELDFLRSGDSPVLVPSFRLTGLKPYDYLAGVYRAEEPLRYQVIVWSVRHEFPVVPVPLDPGMEELDLDLGAIFPRTYQTGAFNRVLIYRSETRPPLPSDDTEWANHLLTAAGLRSSDV
jgi:hypothetical protein